MYKVSHRRSATIFDASLSALVLSVAGWALLETWLLAMHAGSGPHVLATITGLGLACLSGKSLSLRGSNASDLAARPHGKHGHFPGADIVAALFLPAIGALTGILVVSGVTLAIAAAALSISFFPWSRLAFCRKHPVAACSFIWAALAATVFVGRDAINIMFLPLASWALWACAAVVLLLRAAKRRQSAQDEQAPASTGAHTCH